MSAETNKEIKIQGLRTFKALGILLDYPNALWQQGIPSLKALFQKEALLSAKQQTQLSSLIDQWQQQDLLDLQEQYVATFDRVRALSLHLFEHVHGESRDRGQAMIDLAQRYQEHGFAVAAGELPDYLPAFLEYLSFLPKKEALANLEQPAHIFNALAQRLTQYRSPYAVILHILLKLSGKKIRISLTSDAQRQQTHQEHLAMLDQEWQEKPAFTTANAHSLNQPNCSSCAASSSCTQPNCS